jgi:histidinol dehydrogenase
MDIRRLDSADENFQEQLEQLLTREAESDKAVFDIVNEILQAVRRRGDDALLEYSLRFDQVEVATVAELELPAQRLQQAFETIEPSQRDALTCAAARIRAYAEQQKLESGE